jgi:hypothetical protein
MDFVGVRNYPEKAQLLRNGTARLARVPTRNLAYDCFRHVEFLRSVEDGMGDDQFPETLYWKYHATVGRQEDAVRERCQCFIQLYENIRGQGIDYSHGYIGVTTDGIRLNGSHRAAIAYVIGLESLWVEMYQWEELFSPRRIRHIREEARVKRRAQAEYLGKWVHDPKTGARLGKVVFVDAQSLRRWLFKSWRMEPVVVVQNAGGKLVYVPVAQVVIQEDS